MSTPLEIAAELGRTVLGITGVTQGITDNASVNILPWRKGTGLAVTENVDAMYEIDVASLNTREYPACISLPTTHESFVHEDATKRLTKAWQRPSRRPRASTSPIVPRPLRRPEPS